MKPFVTALMILSITGLLIDIGVNVYGDYQYEKEIGSHWELAVKASTIEKKIEGIDNFVLAIDNPKLRGEHNALFMLTPNNGFDENLSALNSLKNRLHEIKQMDIKSFEYQTALAQITQQEQNEAGKMLSVFEGIWWKQNHFMLWNWVGAINVIGLVLLFIFSRLYFMMKAA